MKRKSFSELELKCEQIKMKMEIDNEQKVNEITKGRVSYLTSALFFSLVFSSTTHARDNLFVSVVISKVKLTFVFYYWYL